MTTTPAVLEFVRDLPGRCVTCGWHVPSQNHSPDCHATDEWSMFRAALKQAVGSDGRVHQKDIRPLIQRIEHKHRGQMYKRAKRLGLISVVGHEESNDRAGGNEGRLEPIYELHT